MIGLFVGIESYNWTWDDFEKLKDYCIEHKIKQVILKIYEVTQGEWYHSLPAKFSYVNNGPEQIVEWFKHYEIDVLPYGYFYGNNIAEEITAIKKYLQVFGSFCINLEAEFDNKTSIAKIFGDSLYKHVGTLYCSTWANPASHGWMDNIVELDDSVDVWMPEVYSTSLVKDLYSQFPKVKGKIWPTFHVENVDPRTASIYDNFSLWEYQLSARAIDSYINQKGNETVRYPTNNKGMVANYVPVSQFQPQRSEFECGAFSVALNYRATDYNTPNNNNLYNLIQHAENMYKSTTGSNGPNNVEGASVDDMHKMLKSTNKLHWQDMLISSNTSQDYDIRRIKAAIDNGYPVIAMVTEKSIHDLETGGNPYWWGANGNHILTWVGYDNNSLFAVDPANVEKGDGNLQTKKTPRPWPRKYSSDSVANFWATIVQLPWLPPIPNNDPLSWKPYTPAPISTEIKMLYDVASKQIMFVANDVVVYRINI